MRARILLILIALLAVTTSVDAQFITIARKVKSMHTPKTDVATVLLEAKPFMVYKAVTDTLAAGKQFGAITRHDDKRQVEFTRNDCKITLKVDSLEAKLAQITVASDHQEGAVKPVSDYAVETIVRACKAVGVKCTVDKQ